MRIEQPDTFSEDTDTIIDPVYRLDFWHLGDGGALTVNATKVYEAVDYREVDEWARSQRPHHYVIYCEVPFSTTDTRFFRVGGYEPYLRDEPVEWFISDPDEAREVHIALDEWRTNKQ